jgi:hypothetical protein|tara:strand:- start:4674 stop:5441 length:768 start_codon:yes stop_codon:yes gene_type:complete
MAIVPSTAQFRADTTGVTIVEKGSGLTNARAALFTMQDIVDTIGGGGPTTNNTVYGLNAFEQNINGVNNVAIGSESMRLNQIGSYSTAVGQASLLNNVSGQNNTALGSFANFSNVSGSNNTSVGQGAMQANDNGSQNTVIGQKAYNNSISNSSNVVIGFEAGRDLVFGAANTIVGTLAMQTQNFGDSNTVVGYGATTGSSGCILLGRAATTFNFNAFVVGSVSYPVGNFTTYTGAAAEYWDVEINGVAKKIMLAP